MVRVLQLSLQIKDKMSFARVSVAFTFTGLDNREMRERDTHKTQGQSNVERLNPTTLFRFLLDENDFWVKNSITGIFGILYFCTILVFWTASRLMHIVIVVSEFRQDYLGNYTTPSHPLATSILTSQTQAILSEGDGDKTVRDERKMFFFLPFYSLLFIIIGRYYFRFGLVWSGSVRSSPIQHVII